ncbi:hypothetical protein NDU88_006172 [Pleurodeles waltl]|uniref:Uncharacterized protein n=1 Tax=Pleurodeles waltl TaxID=8319 RepID=A0AAV7SNV9_PLEWA|nr:hypothetical protein NDU88_006172 [Pleurodeles waltl]
MQNAGPKSHATTVALVPPHLLGPFGPRLCLQLGGCQASCRSTHLPSASQPRLLQLVGRARVPHGSLALPRRRGLVPGGYNHSERHNCRLTGSPRAALQAHQPPPIAARQAGPAHPLPLLPPGGRTSAFSAWGQISFPGTTTATRQVLESRAGSLSPRGRSVVDEAPPPRVPLPRLHKARLERRPPGPSSSLFRPTHRLFGSAHSVQAAALRSGARGAASAPGCHFGHRTGPSRLRVCGHRHVAFNRSPGYQLAREPAGAIGGEHQDGIVKASAGG